MAASNHDSVITGAVATGLVTILTVPSLLSLRRRVGILKQQHELNEDELYEDEDGQASEDTQVQFSTWIVRSIVLIAASAGLILQIANCVYMVTEGHLTSGDLIEAWLRVGSWVSLLREIQRMKH